MSQNNTRSSNPPFVVDEQEMKERVLSALYSLLDLPLSEKESRQRHFPVIWSEPGSDAIERGITDIKDKYWGTLPESKKIYFDSSISRFKFVVNMVLRNVPEKAKILDLGCAPGFIGMLLHRSGYEVHGIDLNRLWEAEYPDPEWLKALSVQAVDVEKAPLPFTDHAMDAVIFAEVLEHIAITPPLHILREIRRVLKPGGCLILTTPNVANLANILALAQGKNIFWRPEIFYGSTDRHNREYTPWEVLHLLDSAGFSVREGFLFNSPNNWNSETAALIYQSLEPLQGMDCSLLGNTTLLVASPTDS